MVKQFIKKHKKGLITGIVLVLLSIVVINFYNVFLLPFIQPYFYKINNIEKLIDKKLSPQAVLIKYDVDTRPDCTLFGIKGIREIYAMLQIDENNYNSISGVSFDKAYSFRDRYAERYESLITEGYAEIKVASKHGMIECKDYGYDSVTSAEVYIVLTKTSDNDCYLYIFYENSPY